MKVKVSAVSYLNTRPFLHGLRNSEVINQLDLQLDVPAVCASKLLDGRVDIGLVPVAIIPQLKEHYLISDYCIGSKGKVNTVLLLSDVPLNEIAAVYLDYQSKTSVNLVRVLADNYWNINPEWIEAQAGFEENIKGTTAGVVIGDRTFELADRFKYRYDLSEEWFQFTGLPFVFACWVANKQLPETFIAAFNKALGKGIDSIAEVLSAEKDAVIRQYLTKDIHYLLDDDKRKAIDLFLSYVDAL